MEFLAEFWTEYESYIQLASISAAFHIYYRWQWNAWKAKVVRKEIFERGLVQRICDSNKNVDGKCLLVNAKVARIENNLADLVANVQLIQQDVGQTTRTNQEKFLCLGREIADVRDMKILKRDQKSPKVITSARCHRPAEDIFEKLRKCAPEDLPTENVFGSGDVDLTQKTNILVKNNLACTPRNLDEMRNRIKNFKKSLTP